MNRIYPLFQMSARSVALAQFGNQSVIARWRQSYAVMSLTLICKSKPFGSVTWKLLSVSGLGVKPRRFNSASTALLFHQAIVYAMWSMRGGVTSDGAFRGIMKVLLSLSTRRHCFPVSATTFKPNRSA